MGRKGGGGGGVTFYSGTSCYKCSVWNVPKAGPWIVERIIAILSALNISLIGVTVSA